MACDITQDDLGPLAEGLDPDVAQFYIDQATIIVLGPLQCQPDTQTKWLACCVDPCQAIVLLAQHLIASDPSSGAGDLETTSERVGDVAVTYANASSSSGLFASTVYGRMYANLLAQYQRCRSAKRVFPRAVGGLCGCS